MVTLAIATFPDSVNNTSVGSSYRLGDRGSLETFGMTPQSLVQIALNAKSANCIPIERELVARRWERLAHLMHSPRLSNSGNHPKKSPVRCATPCARNTGSALD